MIVKFKLIVAAVYIATFIWRADWFQRAFYLEQYYQKQIAKAERSLENSLKERGHALADLRACAVEYGECPNGVSKSYLMSEVELWEDLVSTDKDKMAELRQLQ